MDLREYQLEAVDQLRARIRAGAKRPLLIMPTGGGKTVVFSHVLQKAVERGSRGLVIAHRRELIEQASRKLSANGVSHGIIQGGSQRALHRPVQVASIQSLIANPTLVQRVNLIVVDEAHHATEKNGYGKLLKWFPSATVLGVTATPWRLDGEGLGDVFDAHVIGSTPRALRDLGFLVPVGGWEYEPIDTSSARVRQGDYVVSDLQASASSRRVVGDIVSEWQLHAGGARTVLFAISVEHSQLMVQAFRNAGVMAEHVDGAMNTAERDGILARLRSGETRVVCNCNVLTEGFDCPELEVCILARPTLSTSLALQMIGRVLRPAPGKSMARIHDHAGVLSAHGHPYQERDYSPTASARAERGEAEKRSAPEKRCPACKSVRARYPCDACGFSPTPQELQLEYEEAALRKQITNEATGRRTVEKVETDEERRLKWKQRHGDDRESKFAFLVRMVMKHGLPKATRVYWWVSGKSEWPPPGWVAEAEKAAREEGASP